MAAKATAEGVNVEVFGAELLGLGEIPQGVTDGGRRHRSSRHPLLPAEFFGNQPCGERQYVGYERQTH